MGCKKRAYDKKTAQTVLNDLRRSKTLPKRPKRIYLCPHCKEWHITSRPERRS